MTRIDSTRSVNDSRKTLLGIYLNDHLAGATGGVELARRLAREHRGTAAGPELDRLATEIAQDRRTLQDMMATLGIPVKRYKVYGGWVAEKASRFKPNARVIRRSPLSTVIELETMRLGVQGKLMGWQSLRTWAADFEGLDTDRLETLKARAAQQSDLLEDLRVQALSRILAPT